MNNSLYDHVKNNPGITTWELAKYFGVVNSTIISWAERDDRITMIMNNQHEGYLYYVD